MKITGIAENIIIKFKLFKENVNISFSYEEVLQFHNVFLWKTWTLFHRGKHQNTRHTNTRRHDNKDYSNQENLKRIKGRRCQGVIGNIIVQHLVNIYIFTCFGFYIYLIWFLKSQELFHQNASPLVVFCIIYVGRIKIICPFYFIIIYYTLCNYINMCTRIVLFSKYDVFKSSYCSEGDELDVIILIMEIVYQQLHLNRYLALKLFCFHRNACDSGDYFMFDMLNTIVFLF
eukprot:TRINITY_DN11866_c0_g1_i3.p2 TRINITY_DN11866_c0_g1~~TRINITY_DN11866_c0_g1_i3.p2  ORF type:complete len:231 (+),score=-24.25 TRINITY_DN11866_c0_g1_i3:796-1488(+)